MGWKVYKILADERELIRDDCSCIDHCKSVARKVRNNDIFKEDVIFEIVSPSDIVCMRSVKDGCWRIKWEWI